MADNNFQDFMDGQGAISTKKARLFFRRKGQVIPFVQCNKFKAKVEKKKEAFSTLGSLAKHHKYVGWEGTGSLGGYVIDSTILQNEMDSLKTGEEQRFAIVATFYGNSTQGQQTVQLGMVSLDELPLGDLESDDGLMEFETDFTFEDVDLLESFSGKQASA